MATHSEIAARWAEQVGTESPRYLHARKNVFVSGDHLYSYGHHFELGRLIGTRANGFFLLNGDRYSVSTAGHQAMLRTEVARSGVPYAIIPYSALEAAGIYPDTIRPLDVQPDRVDSWLEDVGPVWGLEDPAVRATDVEAHNTRRREYRFPGSPVHGVEYLRGWDHGQGAFVDRPPGEQVKFYTPGGASVEVQDGRFCVRRYRHFLGACLFTAATVGRKTRAKFLSAFDENETRPLYFLCELPRCNARTYAQALEALAPRIVHAAIAQGREVTRQGDIFAIPTELDRKTLRKRGAVFANRVPLLGTNHTATESAQVGRAVYARGCLYHDPGFRDRDHARRKMGNGKTWHLIARNTVPRVKQGSRISTGRAL